MCGAVRDTSRAHSATLGLHGLTSRVRACYNSDQPVSPPAPPPRVHLTAAGRAGRRNRPHLGPCRPAATPTSLTTSSTSSPKPPRTIPSPDWPTAAAAARSPPWRLPAPHAPPAGTALGTGCCTPSLSAPPPHLLDLDIAACWGGKGFALAKGGQPGPIAGQRLFCVRNILY